MLLRPEAEFPLALRLRNGTATLGEVYSFISGLYFRGKLAYSLAFGSPPPGLPPALVITPGYGLLSPSTLLGTERLREIGNVPVDENHAPFREPLVATARSLFERAAPSCEFVLLGSLATAKYTDPLLKVMGHRLLFPQEFVGRGDMSRGSLMLRGAREGRELTYINFETKRID